MKRRDYRPLTEERRLNDLAKQSNTVKPTPNGLVSTAEILAREITNLHDATVRRVLYVAEQCKVNPHDVLQELLKRLGRRI